MRRLLVVGTTVIVLAAYVFSREIKREALVSCFNREVNNREGQNNIVISSDKDENTLLQDDLCKLPSVKSRTFKIKNNNSLITLNLKWNFSFGGSKKLT